MASAALVAAAGDAGKKMLGGGSAAAGHPPPLAASAGTGASAFFPGCWIPLDQYGQKTQMTFAQAMSWTLEEVSDQPRFPHLARAEICVDCSVRRSNQ